MEDKKSLCSNKCKMFLPVFIGFLLGTILGFLIAPCKNGMTIGSYNQFKANDWGNEQED